MRSSSPSGVRWFCARTRYPLSERKNAASCSPARPLAVRSRLVRASVSRVSSFGAAMMIAYPEDTTQIAAPATQTLVAAWERLRAWSDSPVP
jgi:hypothetical protein